MESGIYKLQSKLFPDKMYIGSSQNLKRREMDYVYSFKYLSGRNKKLENHIIKYGVNDIEFIIIEECHPDNLIEKEQFYISEYKPFFNSFLFAGRRDNENINAQKQAFIDIQHELKNDKKKQGLKRNAFMIHQEYIVKMLCNKDLFPEIIIPFNI